MKYLGKNMKGNISNGFKPFIPLISIIVSSSDCEVNFAASFESFIKSLLRLLVIFKSNKINQKISTNQEI